MSAVDPPSLLESRIAASLWESPFPTALWGSDDQTPPLIEHYSIFAHEKVLGGLNPLTCADRGTWSLSAIAAAAKFMTLYSSRADTVATQGWRWIDPLDSTHSAGATHSMDWGATYTGGITIGSHNVPAQSGYRSNSGGWTERTAYYGETYGWMVIGDDWAFGNDDYLLKSDFTTVQTAHGWETGYTLTDTVFSSSGDYETISSTLSGLVDVGSALGGVCSAFEGAQWWWGDDVGIWGYNDFDSFEADGNFDAGGVDVREIGSYDGALNFLNANIETPYISENGVDSSGLLVDAFTGWSVGILGENVIRLNCSRTLARHNSPTPLSYWMGRIRCSSFGLVEVHVTSTVSTIQRGKVFGLHQDVDIPMPSHPSAPLDDSGTYPFTGDYNFVVINQTPSAWATTYGVTLIYDVSP